MSDWKTVRFDTNWEEKIDPEIIELCDVLNDQGFTTEGSCAGHGCDPYVIVSGNVPDAQLEHLLRYLRPLAVGYLPRVQKEIEPVGHYWYLELKPNDLFCDTPVSTVWARNVAAINHVCKLIRDWDPTP